MRTKRAQVERVADALESRRYITGAEVRLIYDDNAAAVTSRVLENA